MKYLIAGDPTQEFLHQAIEKLKTIPHEAIFCEGDSFKTTMCYNFLQIEKFIKDNCINYLIDATNDSDPTVSRNFFSIAHSLGIKSARLESPKFWHNPYMTTFPSAKHVADALHTVSAFGTTLLTLKAKDIEDISVYFQENFDFELAPNDQIEPKILLACKDGMRNINTDNSDNSDSADNSDTADNSDNSNTAEKQQNDRNLSKFAIVKQIQDSLPDTSENMDELYKKYPFNGLVVNDIDAENERVIADWAIRNKIQTMCIYKSIDEPLKTFFNIIPLINHFNDRS